MDPGLADIKDLASPAEPHVWIQWIVLYLCLGDPFEALPTWLGATLMPLGSCLAV